MDACKSVHAEDQAIRKLPITDNKRRKRVDLLVIRVNRNGSFGNSKPCLHCIWLLSQKLPERGYSIGRVYFSNAMGQIVMCKMHDLVEDDTPHISKYYKDRNYNPRKQ